MRKLKIDLRELAKDAEESAMGMGRAYFDLETGRLIVLDQETLDEEEPEDVPFEEEAESPEVGIEADLIRQALAEAREVLEHEGTRYVEVPPEFGQTAYDDMEDFIDTVEDEGLQRVLARAIRGQGAFRRFKDVLAAESHERNRWFRFKDARLEEQIRAWLASKDIELIEEPGDRERTEQQFVEGLMQALQGLIAAALAFVQDVRKLPGVLRIALVGSLTTDRAEPKDADLLVTVTDDMDLSPLAELARRLQGRAQGFGRGADVFLLDPKGRYLGRTCHWKECRPGVRQRCDALHCGRRHDLHDDLRSVTLSKEVTAAPALELWPRVVAHVPVPQDIETGQVQALSSAWVTPYAAEP
jgi:hypothetical protein